MSTQANASILVNASIIDAAIAATANEVNTGNADSPMTATEKQAAAARETSEKIAVAMHKADKGAIGIGRMLNKFLSSDSHTKLGFKTQDEYLNTLPWSLATSRGAMSVALFSDNSGIGDDVISRMATTATYEAARIFNRLPKSAHESFAALCGTLANVGYLQASGQLKKFGAENTTKPAQRSTGSTGTRTTPKPETPEQAEKRIARENAEQAKRDADRAKYDAETAIPTVSAWRDHCEVKFKGSAMARLYAVIDAIVPKDKQDSKTMGDAIMEIIAVYESSMANNEVKESAPVVAPVNGKKARAASGK